MLKTTGFAIRYAFNNLRRGGLWTVFALFSIAAGVTAVVALRSLGLAIGDTLTSTVRESNNGDITLSRGENSPLAGLTGIEGVGGDTPTEQRIFTPQEITFLEEYAQERDGNLSLYSLLAGIQVTAVDEVTAGRPQFVSVFLIDATNFPPTRPVLALEPKGVPLSALLIDEHDIVVSTNFASGRDLNVGDSVHVSGTSDLFTVKGIVSADEEAGLNDLIAAFFGFVYLDQRSAGIIGVETTPNRISIAFPPQAEINLIQEARYLNREMTPPATSIRNATSLERALGTVTDVIGRLIVISGLGALVIGGVGIINTMLVMVRRRTLEIATLKTFGLKGGQIATLFVWEACLLGIGGSALGVMLGYGLGGVVNRFGEALVQQSLVWRFYPESGIYGMVLGLSITLVFGVLPVLTATKVRPAIVLRPNETHIVSAGIVQSFGALLLVVLSLGVMVGTILGGIVTNSWWGDVLVGLIGTAIGFIMIGLLIVVMWVLVWLISRLPAFGIIDLRLALRNLTSRRWRTATTLLAIAAGMFALSAITFVSQGVREVLQFQITSNLGGNVLIFPFTSLFLNADLAESGINAQLSALDGIVYRTRHDFYEMKIEAINGELYRSPFEELDREFGGSNLLGRGIRTDNPYMNNGVVSSGRSLTADDTGKPYLLVRPPTDDPFGNGEALIQLGDQVTVSVNDSDEQITLEVVGILADTPNNLGNALVPFGTLTARPSASFTVVQVEDAFLNETLLALSNLPLAFVLDISFIDGLITRLVEQMSAIPTAVGWLSLFAAATIMANTVLLATLERRKQIGVLKAIGLKTRRIIGIMLLENSVIALLGATLGLGMSGLITALMTASGLGNAIPIPSNALPLAFLLVGIAVVISWLSTMASARVITQEAVSSVLRYD